MNTVIAAWLRRRIVRDGKIGSRSIAFGIERASSFQIYHSQHQEGLQALGPAHRGLDGRPHHAGGQGHARQGRVPVREGGVVHPGIPTSRAPRPCAFIPRWSVMRSVTWPIRTVKLSPPSVTAFPSGGQAHSENLPYGEVRAAVADGADEIDMVINSRRVFRGAEFAEVQDEISAVVEARAATPRSRSSSRSASSRPTTRSARRLVSRDGSYPRRRLHQDQHGQDQPQRHARQQPGDDRGHPGFLPR